MAEYIDREKILSKVKNNYIEDSKNGYDYYDYLLQDDLMSEPTADVIERSKIDKAIEEMEINIKCNTDPNTGKVNIFGQGQIMMRDILKRNIGE